MRIPVKVDQTLKLSDFITAVSVLISAMALVYAWNKDFSLKEREQANQVRDAASKTLAKLERRKELSLWIFKDIQPLIVESSEHLKNSKDLRRLGIFSGRGSMPHASGFDKE